MARGSVKKITGERVTIHLPSREFQVTDDQFSPLLNGNHTRYRRFLTELAKEYGAELVLEATEQDLYIPDPDDTVREWRNYKGTIYSVMEISEFFEQLRREGRP